MSDTIFHKILRAEIPSAKIYENEFIYSFMDAFPQSQGHALIIAKEGGKNLLEMNDRALSEIILFSKKLATAQWNVFQPDGIKVMQFNGAAAGQTVFYYHMHLIPIWNNQKQQPHHEKAVEMTILQAQANKLAAALNH